jgi:DNA-binding MarR family transcriptional regulator
MSSKSELVSELLEVFGRMEEGRMRFQHEPWRKLDVPLAQLKSLFLIHMKSGINVRELALDLGVTPGNVTSIIDRLAAQDLVTRNESPDDRRIVLLQLTAKGLETIMAIHETGKSNMKRFLERMNEENISALLQGMNALLIVMKQDNEESQEQHPDMKNKTGISHHADEIRLHHQMMRRH